MYPAQTGEKNLASLVVTGTEEEMNPQNMVT